MRIAAGVTDGCPGQIIGILAFDQVWKLVCQHGPDSSIAQHQPVMGAARNFRRSNCDGYSATIRLLHDCIAIARDNLQVAMQSVVQDVLALVP
jgi:hypothetical protein